MPPTNKAKVASKERGKSLAEKASFATHGYALDDDNSNDPMTMTFANGAGNNHTYSRKRKLSQGRNKKKSLDSNGIKSSNIKSTSSSTRDTSGVPRIFRNLTNHSDSHRPLASDTTAAAGPAVASSIATPCFIRNDPSYSDNRTSLQRTPAADPRNPYTRDRFCPPSSAKTRYDSNRSVATSPRSSVHVVTSISENLARETCLATMDAGSPVSIQVHKMGNGLMYSETIAFLEMMQPDEILLNEGRKNSQLCQKVLQLFGSVAQSANDDHDGLDNSINTRDLTGACRTNTVVKFVPRSYFDQNRGAELLRHVAREGAYDATVLEEYILLSSSYALLQYMQICLGADFARSSLDLCMNWGGSYKMAIDRGTISHLELLSNAKTGKANNSLIGTIDCTKTSVGSRLLRMNIMAPPSREDTILARLDLVDTFLEDEQFFYEVMDQLCALPDLEKMLGPIALVPKKRFGGGNKRQVTARMASAGISSLVCIKSALSVVPNFARVLEIQLNSLIARDDDRARGNFTSDVSKSSSGSGDDSSHCSVSSSSVSDKSMHDDDNTSNPFQSDKSKGNNDNFSQALVSTLQLGLGSGPISPTRYGASGSERGHQLLRAILSAMKNPHLQEILDAVVDIFTESTTYSKNSHAMRHQECFALKPNTDGMMDVLRKAFLANVDDIYKLADEYAAEFGFTITVKETTARGYYLSIPIHSIQSDLPPTFIQPVKSGKYINCTTEEVLSLSARAQENVQDLLLMTHDRIQEVIDIARQKHDALASLCDAVALIDMCHSFADNVASSRLPWCRPTITNNVMPGQNDDNRVENSHPVGSGSIAIRNGRYAIDVSNTGLMNSEMFHVAFIPNDTYASAFQNFTVITGINGAGKSSYLKQLAITVILAHCGSYVPAEEAFIPIRDRICTRIGTMDDQEHNISTFMQEMKDTAFICRHATDKSLILIDELGRATSNEDGVAIAWAVAEFLLVKRAMTFFVTHYPQLCRLADVYPNVQNQHLGAIAEENSGEIRYLHKILPGPCKMSTDYGIEIAATCGWDFSVIEMARTIRQEIEKKLPDDVLCQNQQQKESDVDMMAIRHKAETILNDLAKHLVALKSSEGRLNQEARKSYLQDLHDQFASPNDPKVIQMMKNLLLDNEEVTTSSLPLRPEGLTRIKDCSSQHTPMCETQTEIQDVASITSSSSDIIVELNDHDGKSRHSNKASENDDPDSDLDQVSLKSPHQDIPRSKADDVMRGDDIEKPSTREILSSTVDLVASPLKKSNEANGGIGSSQIFSNDRDMIALLPQNIDLEETGDNSSDTSTSNSDEESLSLDDSVSSCCSGELSSQREPYSDSSSSSSSPSDSSCSSSSSYPSSLSKSLPFCSTDE